MANKHDKKLLWHPRQKSKFLVSGNAQLSLYEWSAETSEINLITRQADLQHMKCFAWSPDPSIDDLIAIGTSVGKVDLWRLEANRISRNNTVSGGQQASLPVRSTRACNALAFSAAKPNLLAVGLDKVRGDPSLVIWDVNMASNGLLGKAGTSSDHRSSLQDKPDGPLAPVRHYAPAEVVAAVSFLPNSPNALVACVSNLWLRQYDLRSPLQQHIGQAPAAKSYGIAVDSLDEQRIACFGESGVTVWDTRKITAPLLNFSSRDATGDGYFPHFNDQFVHAEFSPVRRGRLATLTRDASYVRFWDIQSTPFFETTQEEKERGNKDVLKDVSRVSKLSRLSWATPSTILPWNVSPEVVPPPQVHPGTSSVVLSNTSRGSTFERTIASFTLTPSPSHFPQTSSIAVVHKDGSISMRAIHDVPTYPLWSSRGQLGLASGTDLSLHSGYNYEGPIPEPWELEQNLQSTEHCQYQINRIDSNAARPDTTVYTDSMHPAEGRGRSPVNHSKRQASSLSAARLSKGRTYSPASIRQFSLERSSQAEATFAPTAIAERDGGSPRQQPSVPLQAMGAEPVGNDAKGIASSPAARGGPGSSAIMNDISMIMRARVIEGYGLSNIGYNSSVITNKSYDDIALREIWTWLQHAKHLLAFGSAKVHGIDFSFQGILGIWEGLEASSSQEVISLLDGLDLASPSELTANVSSESSMLTVDVNASLRPRLSRNRSQRMADGFHGNYTAALNTLNSRTNLNNDKFAFKSSVNTDKVQRRRLALALCNWKIGEEEFLKWEREGQYAKAACWLLFTNQGGKAIEVLMRSKNETHVMMAGTIAAMLQSSSSIRNQELRDYCERLVVKLRDPHFRIMLAYVICGDWSDVLEEEALPIQERIAIALKFLEDKELTFYLRRIAEDCRAKGKIEGLIVTGLTQQGLDILQNYVDRTGDVQTAAILASYVCPGRYKDRRVERWTEAYRDLLDGWKLFHHRCQFDIDRGKIMKEGIASGDFEPTEWVQRQFLIRCGYCNKIVNTPIQQQRPQEPIAMQRKRSAVCSWCGRALPRCSVCLMSICIITDIARENDLLHSSFRDTIDDALLFCQSCRHGGHAAHILEWFHTEDGERKACPVADCDCYCDE